tara:strand:+ start:9570 stop:10826 length:1257 start_codon:yes stop_codon:yes gene_type:complete
MSFHDIENQSNQLGTTGGEHIIYDLAVNLSEMPTEETARTFSVRGDIGSEFTVHVVKDGTIEYYDFASDTFTNGHVSSSNNLKVSLNSKVYSGEIVFPTGGGTYLITVIPSEGTRVSGRISVLRRKIEKQSSNATVTFKAATGNTSSYTTFPTSTSIGALASVNKFSFNWDITNTSTDANGFGLGLQGDWKDLNTFKNLWFFTTTETVDGAVALDDDFGGYVVRVDDLTDVGVGSYIASVSSGSLDGLPVVVKINTDTKEVMLNIPQAFADGITLTFRADGVKYIYDATGIQMEFYFNKTDAEKYTANTVIKTVRTGSSGTTINLNGTYGAGVIAAGATVTGVGVTYATISGVTASSSAGSIVVSTSQGTLTVGTPVYVNNVVQTFNVHGTIKLLNHPSADKNIYLDVDKFLTPGTSS